MSTQIITVAPEYTLKYDEKDDDLRDRTYQELVRDNGKNAKIRCPCMNREYIITPQWCKTHCVSQKHLNWKTIQQKEHIKKHGHCVSAEQIVDMQTKEIRDLKVNIHQLTTANTKYENKIKNISEKLSEISDENDNLKVLVEEYEKDQQAPDNSSKTDDEKVIESLNKELLGIKNENEILTNDYVKVLKERDRLKYELNRATLNKKGNLKITRQPFR